MTHLALHTHPDPSRLTKAFSVLAHDLTQPFNPCLSSISLWFPLPAPHLDQTLLSVPAQDAGRGTVSSQWYIHKYEVFSFQRALFIWFTGSLKTF